MGFKENYLKLKEDGLPDRMVADMLGMSYSSLVKMKQINGLTFTLKKAFANSWGFTEEQLRHGESIGVSRRNQYKRFRVLGWSRQEACSIPITKKRKGDKK